VTEVHVIRRQEICWQDPASLGAASREISGLELLQNMLVERRPAAPIMSLMRMAFAEISHDLVVMSLTHSTRVPIQYAWNRSRRRHGDFA
jgi:hypothetical protein